MSPRAVPRRLRCPHLVAEWSVTWDEDGIVLSLAPTGKMSRCTRWRHPGRHHRVPPPAATVTGQIPLAPGKP